MTFAWNELANSDRDVLSRVNTRGQEALGDAAVPGQREEFGQGESKPSSSSASTTVRTRPAPTGALDKAAQRERENDVQDRRTIRAIR